MSSTVVQSCAFQTCLTAFTLTSASLLHRTRSKSARNMILALVAQLCTSASIHFLLFSSAILCGLKHFPTVFRHDNQHALCAGNVKSIIFERDNTAEVISQKIQLAAIPPNMLHETLAKKNLEGTAPSSQSLNTRSNYLSWLATRSI